jgi:uncharacterized protein YndB with AHSA1/START domain
MKSRTLSVSISAPPSAVYDFAVEPANLPLWSPTFCRSVARIDGQWIVESPNGPITLGVVERAEGSEVILTLFQMAGMSDGRFAEDAAVAERDLATLKRVIEAG